MVRQRWNPHPEPTWVCCVPSLKHLDLFPDFARRLAAKLGLPFIDAIEKVVDNPPQQTGSKTVSTSVKISTGRL